MADKNVGDDWYEDEINDKLGNRELRCGIEVGHGAQSEGWNEIVPQRMGRGTWK